MSSPSSFEIRLSGVSANEAAAALKAKLEAALGTESVQLQPAPKSHLEGLAEVAQVVSILVSLVKIAEYLELKEKLAPLFEDIKKTYADISDVDIQVQTPNGLKKPDELSVDDVLPPPIEDKDAN